MYLRDIFNINKLVYRKLRLLIIYSLLFPDSTSLTNSTAYKLVPGAVVTPYPP